MEYKNSFTTTGKVITDPVKIHDKNFLEFKILYKEKTIYKIFVLIDDFDLATYVHTQVKKDCYIDVTGKLQLISATMNYSAYILIYADQVKIIAL